MTELNNKAAEEMYKYQGKWFFAIEHTPKTSSKDIEDFDRLLNCICERYNLKWCQAMWREEDMKRIERAEPEAKQ